MQSSPRQGKDGSNVAPPASLLLMSPSSGLTFNMAAGGGPSLIPVSLASPSVDDLDGEGESDSFLGQSPPRSSHDGVGITGGVPPPEPIPMFMPGGASLDPAGPLPAMFSVPGTQSSAYAPPMPPEPMTASSIPSSGPLNRRYVLPPQAVSTSGSHQQHPPVAQVPPMPAVTSHHHSNSSTGSTASMPQQPNDSVQPIGPYGAVPPANNVPAYHPVEAHWFYAASPDESLLTGLGSGGSGGSGTINSGIGLGSNGGLSGGGGGTGGSGVGVIWKAYSRRDSYQLEEAWRRLGGDSAPQQRIVENEAPLATEGGRYDVYVSRRQRCAVFWEEDPVEICRASWFYRPEHEVRYLPYSERMCAELEREYHRMVTTGAWHQPFELASEERINAKETFIFHSPQSMIHIRNYASQENKFPGLVDGETGVRPRVVRRGLDDFMSQLEDGEWQPIDHVVFVVHGIGSICDLRGRSLVHCVNDLRKTANELTKSHFKGHGGRVEFLPVYWYTAMHSEATGVDQLLQTITLRSIPKLRQYTNNTLIDILFYTSPKYCQVILDTVAAEMTRLRDLFMSRRADYRGEFSVAGHSLGSVIAFDLLSHQGAPAQMRHEDLPPATEDAPLHPPTPPPASNGGSIMRHSSIKSDTPGSVVDELDPPADIEELLTRLGITSLRETFAREDIDLETFYLLSDEDIRELGLSLGSRKKITTFLRDHRSQATQLEPVVAAANTPASPSPPRPASSGIIVDPLLHRGSCRQVDFVVSASGTGQPFVTYPQLDFPVVNLFALGSPIALFLATRGVSGLGDDYRLPGCRGFFNIFHPFDPVAYRLETMINSHLEARPVLIPHHKGRKRMHLELKENLARMGADIKTRIVSSFRSTWQTIHDFARAHQSTGQEVTGASGTPSGSGDPINEQDVDQVLTQMTRDRDEYSSTVTEDEIQIGQLNQGRRIDYVLQEAPLESFNDYIFALSSHLCYWKSEDTALLMLSEIYIPMGVHMKMPGVSSTPNYQVSQQQMPGTPDHYHHTSPQHHHHQKGGSLPPPTPPQFHTGPPPPQTPMMPPPPPPQQPQYFVKPTMAGMPPPTYHQPGPPSYPSASTTAASLATNQPWQVTPPAPLHQLYTPSSALPFNPAEATTTNTSTAPANPSVPVKSLPAPHQPPPPKSSGSVLGANSLKPQHGGKLFNKSRKN